MFRRTEPRTLSSRSRVRDYVIVILQLSLGLIVLPLLSLEWCRVSLTQKLEMECFVLFNSLCHLGIVKSLIHFHDDSHSTKSDLQQSIS